MLLLTLSPALLFAALGCAGKNPAPVSQAPIPPPQAQAHVFIRETFDKDPSPYIGRFVADDAEVVDETMAMDLGCREYIEYSVKEAGGYTVDKYFSASTNAVASLGLPPMASFGGSHDQSSVVRVVYEPTRKMIAEKTDAMAFAQCCESHPDQCTSTYVGEFIEGTGTLYHAAGSATELGLDGMAEGVTGEFDVKNGVAWKQAITMTEPVYFAMKVTQAYQEPWDVCELLDEGGRMPVSDSGQYFLGRSDWLSSDRDAYDAAVLHGRVQAVKWVAQEVVGMSDYSGDDLMEAGFSGVAELVKDIDSCKKSQDTPEGSQHKVGVLVFLPESDVPRVEEAIRASAPEGP